MTEAQFWDVGNANNDTIDLEIDRRDKVKETIANDRNHVDALAKLSLLEYARVRVPTAERMGCRVETLDAVVKSQRSHKQPKPAPVLDINALATTAASIIESKDILSLFTD